MRLYFEKIRPLRKATGLQTKVFCRKLDISVSTLWHWEKGSKTPFEKKVRNLAKVLNVPVEQISDLSSEFNKSEHNLSDSIKHWGKDTGNYAEKDISQFKYMISKISEQYEYLTQYSLITNAILSSINSIIYIKDIQQNYLLANDAFFKHLTLSKDFNVNGKKDNDFFSSSEAKQITEQDQVVISTGQPIANIDGYIPGSRKKKFGLFSKFPIFDSEKKIAGIIGVINDITDRKKIGRTQEILGIYIDAMTDCLSIYNNKTHKYIYLNNAYENFFGYPVENFYSGGLIDFFLNVCVHPEDREKEGNYIIEKHWPRRRTFRIVRPNGEIRWIEGNISMKTYLGSECCISINRDITERKHEMEKSKLLEQVLNNSNDVVWIREYPPSKKLVYVSESVYSLYGHKPQVFYRNRDFWIKNCVHHEDKDIQNKIYDQKTWKKDITDVCRIIRADGEIRWIEAKSSTKEFHGKKCIAFIERDITELIISKERIEENVKLEMVKSLKLAGVDINAIAKASNLSVEKIKKL
jgi:PAS domain S-box-containing protein